MFHSEFVDFSILQWGFVLGIPSDLWLSVVVQTIVSYHCCICRAPAEYYADIQATPTSCVLFIADLQMSQGFNQDKMLPEWKTLTILAYCSIHLQMNQWKMH